MWVSIVCIRLRLRHYVYMSMHYPLPLLSAVELESIEQRVQQDYALIPLTTIDIETDTSNGGGLDPMHSKVVAVSVAYSDNEEVVVLDSSSEEEILSSLDVLVASRKGLLVTWNGSGFDMPFLHKRYVAAGVSTGLRVLVDPSIPSKYPTNQGLGPPVRVSWHSAAHVDIANIYSQFALDAKIKWSLKNVAKHLGYTPVEVDRERIHALSPQELREYVASDAAVTLKLAMLLRPQVLLKAVLSTVA